jgi:hypothetical protein
MAPPALLDRCKHPGAAVASKRPRRPLSLRGPSALALAPSAHLDPNLFCPQLARPRASPRSRLALPLAPGAPLPPSSPPCVGPSRRPRTSHTLCRQCGHGGNCSQPSTLRRSPSTSHRSHGAFVPRRHPRVQPAQPAGTPATVGGHAFAHSAPAATSALTLQRAHNSINSVHVSSAAHRSAPPPVTPSCIPPPARGHPHSHQHSSLPVRAFLRPGPYVRTDPAVAPAWRPPGATNSARFFLRRRIRPCRRRPATTVSSFKSLLSRRRSPRVRAPALPARHRGINDVSAPASPAALTLRSDHPVALARRFLAPPPGSHSPALVLCRFRAPVSRFASPAPGVLAHHFRRISCPLARTTAPRPRAHAGHRHHRASPAHTVVSRLAVSQQPALRRGRRQSSTQHGSAREVSPHVSIPRPARWHPGPSALRLVGSSAPASQHFSTPAPSLPPALRPVGAPACQPVCAPTRQHASAPASSTPAPQHASATSLSHRRRRHRHHQRAQRCARSNGAPVLAPTRFTLPRRQGKLLT